MLKLQDDDFREADEQLPSPGNLYEKFKFCSDGYHGFECGREDVYELVLGKMFQEGKEGAASSKRFHQLSLKVVPRAMQPISAVLQKNI